MAENPPETPPPNADPPREGDGPDEIDEELARIAPTPRRRSPVVALVVIALSIEPRGQRDRETFFRLLGSDSRIFVRAADTSQRAGLGQSWTGRLRRM